MADVERVDCSALTGGECELVGIVSLKAVRLTGHEEIHAALAQASGHRALGGIFVNEQPERTHGLRAVGERLPLAGDDRTLRPIRATPGQFLPDSSGSMQALHESGPVLGADRFPRCLPRCTRAYITRQACGPAYGSRQAEACLHTSRASEPA